MEMSCLTSSYFSSIDNGMSSKLRAPSCNHPCPPARRFRPAVPVSNINASICCRKPVSRARAKWLPASCPAPGTVDPRWTAALTVEPRFSVGRTGGGGGVTLAPDFGHQESPTV